jgi:starvation-inducible DNA-binding protein
MVGAPKDLIHQSHACASNLAALHTPTDLKPKAVQEISGALNVLLADMFALYLKTKNLDR